MPFLFSNLLCHNQKSHSLHLVFAFVQDTTSIFDRSELLDEPLFWAEKWPTWQCIPSATISASPPLCRPRTWRPDNASPRPSRPKIQRPVSTSTSLQKSPNNNSVGIRQHDPACGERAPRGLNWWYLKTTYFFNFGYYHTLPNQSYSKMERK